MKIIYMLCLAGLLFSCGNSRTQNTGDESSASNPRYDAAANKIAKLSKRNKCWANSSHFATGMVESGVVTRSDISSGRAKKKIEPFLTYLFMHHKIVDIDEARNRFKMSAGVCRQ